MRLVIRQGTILDAFCAAGDLAGHPPSCFSLATCFYALDRSGSLCLRAGLFRLGARDLSSSPGPGLNQKMGARAGPVCLRFTLPG